MRTVVEGGRQVVNTDRVVRETIFGHDVDASDVSEVESDDVEDADTQRVDGTGFTDVLHRTFGPVCGAIAMIDDGIVELEINSRKGSHYDPALSDADDAELHVILRLNWRNSRAISRLDKPDGHGLLEVIKIDQVDGVAARFVAGYGCADPAAGPRIVGGKVHASRCEL